MPELQEIDRLITGTPAAAPPEAAGPTVQEIDRLIQGTGAKAAVMPPPDMTGVGVLGGVGVEGLQLGTVSPEAAKTPALVPAIPSQAEIMARPPGEQVVPTPTEPIQIPPVAAAPAPVPKTPALPAPYEGPLPKLPEVLTGPNIPGQAVSQALQAGAQSVAEGAKNITEGLTGFLTTARQTPEETFPGHKIRAARQIMDGLFNLGLAPFLAAGTGARELLREVHPKAESTEIVDPNTSAFVREMLGGAPPQRTAESIAALQKPMTVGEVLELALTLGLPAMIHGKAPKPTEAQKPAISEALTPKPQAIPDVTATLERAQEATQRLEAAVKRAEDLSAKAITPPPLEVPPETQPAPEVKPVAPRLEGPSAALPAAAGRAILPREAQPPEAIPAESAQLPAGRIAGVTPPETRPAEIAPPKAEIALPPEDELAALRKELNPEAMVENRPPAGQIAPPSIPTLSMAKPLNVLRFVQEHGGIRVGQEGYGPWMGVARQALSEGGIPVNDMLRVVSEAAGRPVSREELATTLRGLAQARSQGGVKGKETRLAREQAESDVEIAKEQMRGDLVHTFMIYPEEDAKATIFFAPDLQERYGTPQTVLKEIFQGDRTEMERVVAEAKDEAIRQAETPAFRKKQSDRFRELVNRYSEGNPFAERAASAREQYERLIAPTAHEVAMEQSFPLGVGYGRKGGERRLEARVIRAVQAEKLRKDANYYEASASAFDRGEINAQGRSMTSGFLQRSEMRQGASERRFARIKLAKEIRGDKQAWEVPGAIWADSSGYLSGGARDLVLHDHRTAVEQALAAGKIVPSNVLIDYPDLSAERPAFRQVPAQTSPPFFSQLQREIDKRLPARTTPEQIRNIVRSGAVKADEVKWSGLEDYLAQLPAGQMVDKTALQTFLRENEVRIEEIQKGQEKTPTWRKHGNVEVSSDGYKIEQLPNGYFRASAPGGLDDLRDSFEMALQQVQEWRIASGRTKEPTKFERFTLPGGEQYRELLLTLPTERTDLNRQFFPEQFPKGFGPYRSPHWEEPNVLAHVRFDDRVDAAGKKVLFIEELQSDWHQEGRRKGYATAQVEVPPAEVRQIGDFQWEIGNRLTRHGTNTTGLVTRWKGSGFEESGRPFPEGGRNFRASFQNQDVEFKTFDEAVDWVKRTQQSTLRALAQQEQEFLPPAAAFAKTWHELVLKRMLRWAAEHGYDKLAWTTGEQQAERYDLSKHIKRLVYEPTQEGYQLRGELPNGNVHDFGVVMRDRLPGTVGKDVADKIIAGEGRVPAGLSAEGTRQRFLEGVDLKVGGEGLRKLYDQIVPNFLNQYGKKWGARVGDVALQRPGPSPLGGPFELVRVSGLDITPEMRRSVVQEGQPMFMAGKHDLETSEQWNDRWLKSFQPSWQANVRIPGSPFRLTDTWGERDVAALADLARHSIYLNRFGRWVKETTDRIQTRMGMDWPKAEFGGFDTNFGDLGVNMPAHLVEAERNHILLNPWALLEEAKTKQIREPRLALSQVFADEATTTLVHELAHQRERGEDLAHEIEMDRIRGAFQKELLVFSAQTQAWFEGGGIYERFDAHRQVIHESGIRGTPTGESAPPSGIAFGSEHAVPPLQRGTIPGGGAVQPPEGARGGPRPEEGLGRRRGIPGEFPEPAPTPLDLRAGIGPTRREAGQPPELPRSELTDRVAEAGKKFPAEDFARWAESMRGALGPGVEPYLRPAWDKIQGVEATARGEAPPPTEPPKSPFQAPPRPPEATTPPPEGPPPLQEPILTLGRHKEVVDAAGEMFQRAGIERDKERWPILSDQILDAMREGTLELPAMREVLQAHGLTLVEFGESMFRPAIKNAAQRLQILSALQRRLNRMAVEAGRGTEADALLTLAQQVETLRREGGDEAPLKEMSWWRRADNVRRGLLVTQLATAVRNLETQLGRLPIDVLDQALQKAFGGKEADPWAALDSFVDALGQLRPTKGGAQARKASQAQIEALLQAFPKEWDRLFGTYSADIARQAREGGTPLRGADVVLSGAEKIVNTLNFFNRFQEFVVRRSVFWSDLSARLERRGIDAEALARGERRLNPDEWEVVTPDVKASVQKALEMTFAQNAPYGSMGWHFVQFVNKAPIILTGPLPFPRFMVNSLKFLYDFSPLPFLKLMSSAERAKVAAGDTKLLSRATIGTAALLGAWLVRETQPDENKWYELTVPGGATVDIRPFNPFAAYFFLGDLAKRTRTNTLYRTDWRDIVRGIASANVSGGLGLFALDKMITGLGELAKPGKIMESVSQAGGEVLSGLLVPLRTLTDLYAQFDPELQIVRERRGEPLLGPAKAQFGIGEPQYLPTRAEPQKREQPALRQATGITVVSEKNDLEKELDRFQFGRVEVQGPSTGDAVADNLIAKHMGQLAEVQTGPKIHSLRYQGLSDPQRMEWLKVELARIRAIARSAAKREDPELFKDVEAGKVPGRRRLLNEERAGQGLAPIRGR